MFVACVVVSSLLSVLLVISASGKLTRMEKVVEALTTVGVTAKQMPLLASLEIAAAGGIIIGFWVSPLGIAAASGSVLYFVGAMAAHVRVRDFKGLSGPLVPLILSVAALVLRVASA